MSFETARRNWEKLAEHSAFESICTALDDERQTWNEQAFFESGDREIETLFSHLERAGHLPVSFHSALDFGCGVGRLTRALRHRFRSVKGVDASAKMIEKASALGAEYAPQVSFLANPKSDLSLLPSDSFSFIYSVIVLQHIPYPHSLTYIRDLVRVLEPGGLLAFQVPVVDSQSLYRRARRRLTRAIRGRLSLAGLTKNYFFEMNALEKKKVEEAVEQSGGRILEKLLTNHTDPRTYPSTVRLDVGDAQSGYSSTLFIVRKQRSRLQGARAS